MDGFIETDAGAGLVLKGEWTLDHIAEIRQAAQKLPGEKSAGRAIRAEIGKLDTAGALLLHDVMMEQGIEPGAVQNLQPRQRDLLQLIAKTGEHPAKKKIRVPVLNRFFIHVGKGAENGWRNLLDLLRFIGETTVRLGGVIRRPGTLRFTSLVRHINETGVAAIPIVSLIAFLISIVLAYQGANQLRRFGAEIFTINMVAVSVLREMGVLLTAIMLAGRSGSAFTAEIGVMKVNEEVDAMRIIGVKPFDLLVMPRLLALVITLPLLTFIADLMGLLGGGIISYNLMDIGFDQYLDRFRSAVGLNDFFVGIIKAPVFAFFIAVVGCMRGMQVSGSAESVGRLTTISVVQSIFIVLLMDALFAVLFTQLGI